MAPSPAHREPLISFLTVLSIRRPSPHLLFLSIPSSSGGGWVAGSSVQPPVDQKAYGSERCSVFARCQGRNGCSTLSSASISLNPNLWCRATEMFPVGRTGLSATGKRYVFFLHSFYLSDFGLFQSISFASFLFAVSSHMRRRCSLSYSHVCSSTQEDLRPLDQTSVQIPLRPAELP